MKQATRGPAPWRPISIVAIAEKNADQMQVPIAAVPAARAVLTATTISVAVASTKAATTSTRIMGA
jgi:hypothetical protein